MPRDIPTIYVLVRRDLSGAQQIVQVAHATYLAGTQFGAPPYHHLVLCAVSNEEALLRAQRLLEQAQIRSVLFYEPDADATEGPAMGQTALCTEPLTQQGQRNVLRGYPLWKEA